MSASDQDDVAAAGLDWTSDIDSMLARWCDQAKCFEWMHSHAFSIFDYRSRIIGITTNILTAVSGISNVIIGRENPEGFSWSSLFGSMSIIISIANMLQEKLAYASRATSHEHFSIHWGTIRRKIEEEILLPPASRKDCRTFLKYIRQDINQVSNDGNAKIPQFIKELCKKKFEHVPNFDIPDICGQLEHTRIYMKPLVETLRRPLLEPNAA